MLRHNIVLTVAGLFMLSSCAAVSHHRRDTRELNHAINEQEQMISDQKSIRDANAQLKEGSIEDKTPDYWLDNAEDVR